VQNANDWEVVVGLEVHAQLNTKTKLFSRAANRFGDDPNTNLSIVCTAQPGALPLLNRAAVHKAVTLGLGLGSEIAERSYFDRKSYFYPDAPRNFQITQFYHPLLIGGHVTGWVGGERRLFAVNRAHLEDDAGTLKHFSSFAGVDYNRAGVPLIEIVSEPCIHSAEEAAAYVQGLKVLLQYLDVSDASMELGHLRVDCNISVRRPGEALRPRIEIKNMNSIHNLQIAIEAESQRQIKLYEQHPQAEPSQLIQSGTYRFDLDRRQTVLMRAKEASEDYRYCPEPDIPALVISKQDTDWLVSQLPELPAARYERYVSQLEIPLDLAWFVVHEKELCEYFERGLSHTDAARQYANWVLVEFLGRCKPTGTKLESSGIHAAHIAELVNLIESGQITGKIAKSVADDMFNTPGLSPAEIVAANPAYQPLADSGILLPIVKEVISGNAQSVADWRAGKQRAFGYLVGQVMAKTKGRAEPSIVNKLIAEVLEGVQ